MKIFLSLALFSAISLSARALADNIGPESWGSATNYIELGIGIEGNERQIKTNQSFQLMVYVKNISTNNPFYFLHPLAIFNGDPVSFEVISPSGKDVSPVSPRVEHGSAEMITVSPNQIYEYDFDLCYLCKFDEVGTYKILGKMNVSTARKKVWAISNPLRVTVIPDK